MRNLVTDWVQIGQSGYTADNRKIESSWLYDCAETYNTETYTAVLWWEHFRFFGNFGKVTELRAEEQDGKTVLLARLAPNARLIELNQDDQSLFTSMELVENFAQSGKFYLAGLSITDSPASLGTSELKFTKRKQYQGSIFSRPLPFDFESEDFEAMPTFLERVGQHFGLTAKPKDKDTDTMTPEQMSELKSFFSTQVEELKAQGYTPAADDEETVESENNYEFSQEMDSIKTAVAELTQTVQLFQTQLNDAIGEEESTETPDNNGAAEARVL